jgi:uncharacterized protein (UPF0332 family)
MLVSSVVKLKQHFIDDLRHFKNKNSEEWKTKYRKATHRVLSSVFFYVSGKTCFDRKNNLMAAIAFYYSLYYMTKALLFLLPTYSVDALREVNHSKLLKLMKAEFVNKKLLNEDFVVEMDYLKQVREKANYSMGSWFSLNEILEKEELKVKACLSEAISLLKEIVGDDVSNIMSLIGDGIGDDWMDSYISKEEERAVVDFFLENQLTT